MRSRSRIDALIQAWERDRPEAIAVDTETTGYSWYDELFCTTISWADNSHYIERGYDAGLARLLQEQPRLVFHNAKFDLNKLILAGYLTREQVTPEKIEDTEALAALLWPWDQKKLKVLAKRVLGLETDEAEALTKAKKALQKKVKRDTGKTLYAKEIGYHMLPRRAILPYAKKDAEYTWLLWCKLKPMLDDELLHLYEREMVLTLVLLDIEAKGMKVDLEYVNREVKVLNGKILECELVLRDITGLKVWYPDRQGQKTPEGCFNPNSGQQIQAWLAEQGIELDNTQAATLTQTEHPLAQTVIDLRKHKKLLDTYLLNMRNDQRDGIIHPNFAQHRPKTGRTSSRSHDGD